MNDANQDAKTLLKIQPSELSGEHITKAIKALASPIKAAKEKLKNIPLKEIVDPLGGEVKWARFATAEELQKILNETCFGKVAVDTMPAMMGTEPSVVAYVLITTEKGIVRLPGSFASQKIDVVSGDKSILWAETRAIRRALRALGLRAETDFLDGEEMRLQEEADKAKENDADSSPEAPEKTVQEKVSDSPEPKEKSKTSKAPGKRPGKKSGKTSGKSALEIPKEPLDVKVARDAPGFPNRKSSTYYNKLMDGLRKARAELGVSVEVFVRHVFGEKSFPDRKITLQSLTTEELEQLFQHYILDQESEI